MSAWQCPKKLHLEKHHPELAEVSPQTESLFATGNEVGEIARQIYGAPTAVMVPFERQVRRMLGHTSELLRQRPASPIFEATFVHDGILVRVDVLLPDDGGWRVIEIKASTSVKDYHLLDCAIQDWVLRRAGVEVTRVAVAHVDNQFVYAGDGNYRGLLTEVDVSDRIRKMEPGVDDLVRNARAAVRGSMPNINVGAQCGKPYDCQFMGFCWPSEAEYPVAGLGGSKAKLGEYVALGCKDIRDVDMDQIRSEKQRRIRRVTQTGVPEILEGAKLVLEALSYPRYYLDFETIGPAVPFWEGTRPYAPLPVQWSCHVDDGIGNGSSESLRHAEFLDLSGRPPMRGLAEDLIAHVGTTGPVLVYTSYEEKIIRGLVERFADLAEPLNAIIERLFDLYPVVKANYYHPRMLGSWSIKAVLPTIAPAMDYATLDGINEGTAASDGFMEAIRESTSPERKEQLRTQLLRYCRFDTEAMFEIVRFFCAASD